MFSFLICNRALKIGGVEVAREKWDEADAQTDPDEEDIVISPQTPRKGQSILPDWTRTSLPVGAPPARPPALPTTPMLDVIVSPPQRMSMTAVSA